MNPTPGVRFLSLELRDSLLDVCSEHGNPLSEKRSGTIRFHLTERGREQWTPYSVLRKLVRDLFFNWAYPILDVCAGVYGEWPLCALCVRRRRRLRQVARALMLLGPIILAAAFAARYTDHTRLAVPLFIAFFPFWLPGGLLAGPSGTQSSIDIPAPVRAPLIRVRLGSARSTRSESSPRQLRFGKPGPCATAARLGRNNFASIPDTDRS